MDSSEIKILIVDDEPDILNFLRYNLEKENEEGIKEVAACKRVLFCALPVFCISELDIFRLDSKKYKTGSEL